MVKRTPTNKIRGVSSSEYFRIRRAIERGELTWLLAEQQGLCEPKAKTGPKIKPFHRKRKQLESPKVKGNK